MSRVLTLTLLILFFFPVSALAATRANYAFNTVEKGYAGGNAAQISVTILDTVVDPNTAPYKDSTGEPLIVGEEFRVVTHVEKPGDHCELVTPKSSQKGELLVKCISKYEDGLAFHIEPISKLEFGSSRTYTTHFRPLSQQPTPEPTPIARQASPSPTPSPVNYTKLTTVGEIEPNSIQTATDSSPHTLPEEKIILRNRLYFGAGAFLTLVAGVLFISQIQRLREMRKLLKK